jgi:hypothetical protein
MRGYGNAQRFAQQAQFVASAAIGVRTTSDSAAAAAAIDAAASGITGGASATIADLKARIDAAGIP